jgi:signal transduction histidine kinase
MQTCSVKRKSLHETWHIAGRWSRLRRSSYADFLEKFSRWREDMIEERPRTSRYRSMDKDTAAVASTDPRILLASIVHDFNNLLTPIVTIMEELQRQEVGSPRQLRRIDGAIFCAFRAKTLARQLLDFANPRKLQPAAVDISQLLESLEPVLAGVLPTGYHHSVRCRQRSSAGLHRPTANRAGVAQSGAQRPRCDAGRRGGRRCRRHRSTAR